MSRLSRHQQQDPHCTCPDCVQAHFDSTTAAAALGRLGGQATSEAKTAAARINAKKGGWPKGKPRKPSPTS